LLFWASPIPHRIAFYASEEDARTQLLVEEFPTMEAARNAAEQHSAER
jgi:hypothetical protein